VGVQNFPTVGLIDGNFRQNLEETGMGYDCEVELIKEAKKLGMLTTPYVFNVEEAKKMAEAGADIIVGRPYYYCASISSFTPLHSTHGVDD
jgi:predicted TIM-barrel enzyme